MLLLSLACGGGPVASIELSATDGEVPLTVELDASGTTDATGFAWQVDGETYEGELAEHTFLGSGSFEVTLTVTDDKEREDVLTATVEVSPPSCPTDGEVEELGEVQDASLTEISGVAEGRLNEDILWVHNDAGHATRVHAIGTDGTEHGIWKLQQAPSGDLEDIAAVTIDGVHYLVVADTGDNNKVRDDYTLYLVEEPEVPDGVADEKTNDYLAMTVRYPGGAEDCEAVFADPVTGDIYLVTKDYEGYGGLYRKAAPHADGDDVELEDLGGWDLGQAVTGGDLSPSGHLLVLRTYTRTAFAWTVDRTDGFVESLLAEPTCELTLPGEQQGEAVAFTVDGSGLWVISEGSSQPVRRVALE